MSLLPPPPHCYRSSTFIDRNKKVTIEYSQGGFNGYIGSDRLWFGPFSISDVSVAIIEESWNFFGTDPQWQGILGLAFDSLMKVTMVMAEHWCTSCDAVYDITITLQSTE